MKNKSFWVLLVLFCFIFFGYSYLSKNLDQIFAVSGDFYYKKNDIASAQKYYEKAFELGFNKTKQREIYVNSIINSSLTADAQEKLIKFLDYPKEDVATLKAKYFIYNLRREIHRKFPDNYITHAVHNQKIIRWAELPIKYSFTNTNNVPKYFVREIENAFTEWEKATNQEILFVEDSQAPNIIIKFDMFNPADEDDQKYVVAYTVPIINLDKLKNMEIIFYLKDLQGKYFSQNQVYNTALHEIVHALGFMGHCNDKENIMYLTKDSASLLNDSREDLTEADINTVKLLYKIKPQITDKKNVSSEFIPALVLGEETEIVNEKIKEAKIYIRKAPNLPAGYIDLAEGYVAIKDYSMAIRSLKKALTLADTDEVKSMIYFNLAVTNFYLDNLKEALECLCNSIYIKDSEEKHYLLGEIYLRQGSEDLAIKEYSNLIAQNPKNIEYVIALTNIYVLNKNYLKARNVLKNYVINNPNDRNNPRFHSYGIIRLGL